METLKKHKKEIIISMLTGIFLFYVQPVLNFLGDIFVNTFILLSDKFSNDYYISIAKNNPNTFADSSNFLLIIIISIILFYLIEILVNKKNELKKRIEKTLSDIARTKGRFNEPESVEQKSKEEILKELAKLEDDSIQIRDSIYKRDNNLLSLYILSFFLMILLFTTYAINKSVENSNVEFRNNLIKIAPYTDEEQINIFKAKRVSIKNKCDYDSLNKYIQEIKDKNKIE